MALNKQSVKQFAGQVSSELKKHKKLYKKMLIITIVSSIFLAMTLMFVNISMQTPKNVTKAEMQQLITVYESIIDTYEKIDDKNIDKLERDNKYQTIERSKASIKTLQYVIDKDLDTSKYSIVIWDYSGLMGVGNYTTDSLLASLLRTNSTIGNKSWSYEAFFGLGIANSFSMLQQVLIIISAIIVSIIIGNEFSSKTIRLAALRPVTRNKLLSIKLAAVIFQTFVLSMVMFFCQLILTGLGVGYDFNTVITTYIGLGTARIAPVFYLTAFFFNQFFEVLFFALFAFMFAVVSRSKVVPIIITIALTQISGISVIAPYFKVPYLITFLPHTRLNNFLTVNHTLAGMNYFASLTVSLLYMALFVGLSYLVFRKRDLA